MPTTIQITEKTLRLLRQLKGRLKVKTYDEVIGKLLSKKVEMPRSLLGAHPAMPSFTPEDHLKFHDED